jgi:hypothetical protein
MPYASAEEFISTLTRTFASYRPRTVRDVSEKGQRVLQMVIPNETCPRYSLSIDVTEYGRDISVSLWFGQTEITNRLPQDDAAAAITEFLEDRMVTVARYKNRDAYDDCRPMERARVCQLSDDEEEGESELARLLARLETPATWLDRLLAHDTGVFEIARWSEVRIVER